MTIQERAHSRVESAIMRGKLIRPRYCESCKRDCSNNRRSPHAHHDDYSKPLEVRWLCEQCHIKWHLANGPGFGADISRILQVQFVASRYQYTFSFLRAIAASIDKYKVADNMEFPVAKLLAQYGPTLEAVK